MKSEYERLNYKITEFDTEDIITTSGEGEEPQPGGKREKENAYSSFSSFNMPGNWF